MIEEIWVPVLGFDGYQISNIGRIRSDWRRGSNSGRCGKWRVYLGSPGGRGYLKTTLRDEDRMPVTVAVHVIMLESFIGPRPTSAHVARHLNDIKTDNRIDNLAWGTPKQNFDDAVKNGRARIGDGHGATKLSEAQVAEIRAIGIRRRGDAAAVALRFGVTQCTIRHIVSRRSRLGVFRMAEETSSAQ